MDILKKINYALNEGRISDLRKTAKQYPGSYSIIDSGSCKIGKLSVKYLRYTNPNNATDAEYINYEIRGGKDGSITVRSYEDTIKALENKLK
jgi:hypothetical protein